MGEELRKSGIDVIGDIPWGTHFCQFYQTKKDLVETLVPYFKEGLENNEFCMWVTSEPLNVEDAKASLKKVVKNLDDYIERGQIEILDYSQWYTKSGRFEPDKVLQGWVEKERRALKMGFDGFRLTGNTFWLETKYWKEFVGYEAAVNNVIGQYRMIALCSYPLDRCGAAEVMDIIGNHDFALIRRKGEWETIESAEHKRLEKELRESEEKFRGIVERSFDIIFMMDPKGRFTYVSPSVERAGYRPGELVGKTFRAFLPKSEFPKGVQTLNSLVNGETVEGLELEVTKKDGSTAYIELNASPIIRDGEVVGAQGILRTITERKRMKEELTHEYDLMQTLMDNIPDAIYFKNAASRFTRINRAHAQRMGAKDPKEALGKTDFDFYAEEFAREVYEDEQKILKTGQPLINKIERIIQKDGEIRWVSATKVPIKDKEGQITGIVGISRDITERKQMEEEMRETKNYLNSLLNYANAPIIVWDNEGRITLFNNAFEAFTGYKKESVLERNIDVLFPPLQKKEILQTIEKATKGEKWKSIEIPILCKDKKTKIALWNSANITDKEGKIVATIAQGQDITERKRLNEELRRYSKHLEELVKKSTKQLRMAERLAAIGETAAMVGHDLRNPLQAAVNAVYLAREKLESMSSPPAEKQDVKELLGTIEKQTDYMNKIVSDLQDYARPLSPELHRTSLQRLIDNVLSSMKVPENIEVSVETDVVSAVTEEELKLMVDPMLMRRVFTNLVTNALQAMPDGGKLTVRASKTEDAALISVEDTGVGIPEDVLPKLFQPLYTIKAKGMGLGLAVCKRLVEAHGGTITVESKVGRGTTVTVKIPL